MQRWLSIRPVCPLCQQEWLAEFKHVPSLKELCAMSIAGNPEVVLQLMEKEVDPVIYEYIDQHTTVHTKLTHDMTNPTIRRILGKYFARSLTHAELKTLMESKAPKPPDPR